MPIRNERERSRGRIIAAPARLALDFTLFVSVLLAYPFLAIARRVTRKR